MSACRKLLEFRRILRISVIRRFSDNVPSTSSRETSLWEILESQEKPKPPTRTEIIQTLRSCSANWKNSATDDDDTGQVTIQYNGREKNPPLRKSVEESLFEEEYGRFVRTDCDKCGGELSNLVSTVDGLMTCTVCHHEKPFVNYKKRVTIRKTETTREDEVKREEEKRIEETLRRMESPEEYDSDIHDHVSYLNLMSQFKENQSTKKKDRMMRIRDDTDAPSPRGNSDEAAGGSLSSVLPDPNIKYLWNASVDIGELVGIEENDILQLRILLGIERISTETLSRYNVRAHMDNYDQSAILYPRYRGLASRLRPPAGLKVIRKIGDKLEKENYPLPDETMISQRFSGIFGYHMMTSSDRAVVLTTNERDALAIYEATNGALALALPQGERLDASVMPYLEDFEQIFLWFPIRHLEYAKEWGCALNGSRCFLIKSQDRPIELVRSHQNKEVKIILSTKAVRVRDKGFRSMTDIREDVKADLLHSTIRQQGLAQWKRFSPLNKYLQGFRPGELTVLTGGTGFGKTTFLCEYALDLFTQGVRTLFCSFEMPEEKILKWMLVQYAGKPLHRVEFSDEIDQWMDKFVRTKGPLTIMKSAEFMDKPITQIALAIRNHVVNSGVQHVVIDNLQFLINQTTMANDQSSGFDKFHHQDRFVGLMRKLASEHQVHITMVVHPRKTDADTDLDIQHFGGSARVTQEADNVLAIQRRRDEKDRAKFKKFLYILKNRYGGRKVESDQLEMVFQSSTYSHTLVDHSRN